MQQNKTPFIKAPKVHRIITYERGKQGEITECGEGHRPTYLIMEYICGKTVRQIMTGDAEASCKRGYEFYGYVAKAEGLIKISSPNDQIPGPAGGEFIINPLFGEEGFARCQYRSVKEIETYFNKVHIVI